MITDQYVWCRITFMTMAVHVLQRVHAQKPKVFIVQGRSRVTT